MGGLRLIHRDPEAAADITYDLTVIGGGVYGIALCLEASRQGFTTLLVERGDFGGETSWNSLRIHHCRAATDSLNLIRSRVCRYRRPP